jgi:hypothetical protein
LSRFSYSGTKRINSFRKRKSYLYNYYPSSRNGGENSEMPELPVEFPQIGSDDPRAGIAGLSFGAVPVRFNSPAAAGSMGEKQYWQAYCLV